MRKYPYFYSVKIKIKILFFKQKKSKSITKDLLLRNKIKTGYNNYNETTFLQKTQVFIFIILVFFIFVKLFF